VSIAIRIALVLGVLSAVAALGAWGYRAIYDAGLTAGRAEIQTKWDADKIATQKLADAAQASNALKLEAAAKFNQETIDAFDQKLTTALADAHDYAVRLYNAETHLAAGSHPVPGPAGVAGAPAAAAPSGQGSVGIGPEPSGLDSTLGARLTECDANESQLSALQAEIVPQL